MANSLLILNPTSTIFILLALFTLPHSLSQSPPSPSPSPSPELPADVNPPPSPSPSHSPIASPPSPSTSPAPAPSPTSYGHKKGMMHPSPALAADVEDATGTSSSIKGGQKAGIALGVIAGVCVVGVAALVYKKRRQNIQRAQFGYAARRDIL